RGARPRVPLPHSRACTGTKTRRGTAPRDADARLYFSTPFRPELLDAESTSPSRRHRRRRAHTVLPRAHGIRARFEPGHDDGGAARHREALRVARANARRRIARRGDQAFARLQPRTRVDAVL